MTSEKPPSDGVIKFGRNYSEGKIQRGAVVSVNVEKFLIKAAENSKDNILINSLGKFIDADRSRMKYIENTDLFWDFYKKIEDELGNNAWRVSKVNEDGTFNIAFKNNLSSSRDLLKDLELLSVPKDFLVVGNKKTETADEGAEVVKLDKTAYREHNFFPQLFKGDAIEFTGKFEFDTIDPMMPVKMNDSDFVFSDLPSLKKIALKTLIERGEWELVQQSENICEISSKLGPLLIFSIFIDREKIKRKSIEGRASYLPYDFDTNTKMLTFFAELRHYNQNFSNATDQYRTELSEPAIFSELKNNVWEIENSSDENFYIITYVGKVIPFLTGQKLYIPKKIV
jgi:hypothetical protein